MLRNGERTALTTGQIAAHLGVKIWNVTRELQLGEKRQPGRLRGAKLLGSGVGRGGQWRVDRNVYLDWLQIPVGDRDHPGADGLPELIELSDAGRRLEIAVNDLAGMINRLRWPHIAFGRNRYLTHNQLERLRVQLIEDCRDMPPVDPGAVTQG